MAPHSSTLAWKIPWTEEPGGLQSMGSLRVRHHFTFTFHFHALGKEMATHSTVLAWRIPGTGSLVGCRLWVAQSRTRLMRLSSSSSRASRRRRQWQPTPVFLPGKSQGQRTLQGCCLWGRTESDTINATQQQQQQQSLQNTLIPSH